MRLQPVFALVAAILVASAVARAQPAGDGGSDDDRARQAFWEGNEAYAAGEYEDAIGHFERAYGIAPTPRLLDYIGRCHANLQQYEQAIEHYQRYADTSVEAEAEVAETLANLIAERQGFVGQLVRHGVGEALSRARGEQPPSRQTLRQSLGTEMRDVTVQILSTPRAAEVYIDGMEFGSFGITPMETPLFTGPHMIEVRKPYFEPARRIVNVAPPGRGEAIPTVRFELERVQLLVTISVEPVTATVTYVSEDGDRQDLGLGGYEGSLPAGPGAFIVQQGGRDRRVSMTLEPPEEEDGILEFTVHLQDQDLAPTLDIRIGILRIVTELLYGEIFVDGRSVGEAPGEFEVGVTPGEHTVEVRRQGYETFRQEVSVAADGETVVYANTLERSRRRGRR